MENEIPLVDLPEWPYDAENQVPIVEFPDWPENAGPLPRYLRTPHTAAYGVLTKLDAWGVEHGFQAHEFMAEVFLPLWEDNLDPDEYADKFDDLCKEGHHPQELIAEISAAMCARAFRVYSKGEVATAWSYAMDAECWYSILLAGTTGMDFHRDAKANMGKKGADARHVKSRTNKDKVFVWCDENMMRFSSMDDAAADIAETFVPEKFRTVREWMTNWKKLRSAGTP